MQGELQFASVSKYRTLSNKLEYVPSINSTLEIEEILLSTTNKMQRYTIFFIIVNAVHVSGRFSARNMHRFDTNKEYCITLM